MDSEVKRSNASAAVSHDFTPTGFSKIRPLPKELHPLFTYYSILLPYSTSYSVHRIMISTLTRLTHFDMNIVSMPGRF